MSMNKHSPTAGETATAQPALIAGYDKGWVVSAGTGTVEMLLEQPQQHER